MGAFDTSFKPKGIAPASTAETTLFTAGTDSASGRDCQVLVDVCNITSTAATCRVGVVPSGGSVHWKVYNVSVEPDNPITGLGPYFLQTGDAIRVQSGTANALEFSVGGTESS